MDVDAEAVAVDLLLRVMSVVPLAAVVDMAVAAALAALLEATAAVSTTVPGSLSLLKTRTNKVQVVTVVAAAMAAAMVAVAAAAATATPVVLAGRRPGGKPVEAVVDSVPSRTQHCFSFISFLFDKFATSRTFDCRRLPTCRRRVRIGLTTLTTTHEPTTQRALCFDHNTGTA